MDAKIKKVKHKLLNDVFKIHHKSPYPIFFMSWAEIAIWLDDRGLKYDTDTLFNLDNEYNIYRKNQRKNV